jgi:hypothetical protein
MNTNLLQIMNLPTLPINKQKEYIKNLSEGYNQDIYVCPEKKNLVRLKKQFIKKLSKKRKEEQHHTIAYVLLQNFNTKNSYFYVDYGDDKYKNNNYYECYQFSANELMSLQQEGALYESIKDKLIDMKKEADVIDTENIVCFGKNWRISCLLPK